MACDPDSPDDNHAFAGSFGLGNGFPKLIDAAGNLKMSKTGRLTGNNDRPNERLLDLLHLQDPYDLLVIRPLDLDRATNKPDYRFHHLSNRFDCR